LNRYYIGSTKDIVRRIEDHLWNHKGFTSKAKDWQLRYQEVFGTKTEALTREKHIKRWKSRKMIEKLISYN
jgi:putative endonuclease